LIALQDLLAVHPSAPAAENQILVIRPSWRSFKRYLQALRSRFIGLALLMVSASLSALAFSRGSLLLGALLLGICGLALAVGAFYTLYYMLGTKIVVTAKDIRVDHLFRHPGVVPVDAIQRVVCCTLVYSTDSADLNQPAIFAMDGQGHCVLSLYMTRWDWQDLQKIWARLGIRPDGSWDDLVAYQDVATRFPSQE
jgi:hypothetical protein